MDPRRSSAFAVLAIAVTLLLGACGVEADSSGALPGGGSTTTFPLRPGGSTTTEPKATDGVAPSKIPPGYRALSKKGIGVGIAVPEDWTDPGIDVGDLSKGAEALGDDSELGNLAGMFGTLTEDAELMAAVAKPVGAKRDSAIVIQLSLSIPSIPKMMVSQVESQFASMGASDVEAKLVAVPGLDPEVRALDVSATMTYGTNRVPIRELMVPTELGLALVVVGADRVTADTILSTVGA